MTDIRRCYLHVGTPKTGTSFLQSVAWASRDSLAAQGLELPLHGLRDHFWLTVALRGRLGEADAPGAHTVLDRLQRDLQTRRASRLLISHELLAPVAAEQTARLRAMLTDLEVHVVITARDLARQIPAEWQQSVKHGSKATYERFLTGLVERRSYFWSMQDVADVATRWGGSLPPERVHVVTVPPAGAPPGLLLERFCSVLAVDPHALSTEVTRDNPSMGMAQTELLRRVNVVLGDAGPGPSRGVKDYLGNRVLAPQGGDRPVLPARLDAWCQEAAQEMVGRLERAGYDVVGDLSDLAPAARLDPAAAESAADETAVGADEVSDAAVRAIASMLEQRQADVGELRRLRRADPRAYSPAHSPAGSRAALRGPVPRTVAAVRRRLRRLRRHLG